MDISKPTSTAPSIRWTPCVCHCTSASFQNGQVCGLKGDLEPNPYLRKTWRSKSQDICPVNLGGVKCTLRKRHSPSRQILSFLIDPLSQNATSDRHDFEVRKVSLLSIYWLAKSRLQYYFAPAQLGKDILRI